MERVECEAWDLTRAALVAAGGGALVLATGPAAAWTALWCAVAGAVVACVVTVARWRRDLREAQAQAVAEHEGR